jgi:hypothetical protein
MAAQNTTSPPATAPAWGSNTMPPPPAIPPARSLARASPGELLLLPAGWGAVVRTRQGKRERADGGESCARLIKAN